MNPTRAAASVPRSGVATPPSGPGHPAGLCGHCGREIEQPRPGQKACSPRCRWALWKGGRQTADTRRAVAALGAVRARLTGPGYFGDEARRELLRFVDMAQEALGPGDAATGAPAEPAAESLELRIGLMGLRAQVDDLLARVERGRT